MIQVYFFLKKELKIPILYQLLLLLTLKLAVCCCYDTNISLVPWSNISTILIKKIPMTPLDPFGPVGPCGPGCPCSP